MNESNYHEVNMRTCVHHTDSERAAARMWESCAGCPVCNMNNKNPVSESPQVQKEQESRDETRPASKQNAREGQKRLDLPASYYATLIPRLREIAAIYGYALALHGSLTRDCDLIAVPWQEWAHSPLTLVTAIRDEVGGYFHSPDPEFESLCKDGAPSLRPHGRLSYSIHLTARGMDGPYLDISVTQGTGDSSGALNATPVSQSPTAMGDTQEDKNKNLGGKDA